MRFTKMHGCGNDYIYIDAKKEGFSREDKGELVRRLSDRHFGIGGDGVIFIQPAPEGMPDVDFEMEMYNADGSRSEMCGNGIRCVGAYVYVKGLTDKKELTVISAGAKKYLTLHVPEGKKTVDLVTVDMGAPILDLPEIPVDPDNLPDPESVKQMNGMTVTDFCQDDGGVKYRTSFVSMGNPHAVVVLPDDIDLEAFPLEKTGPRFENHPAFPKRTNTEFVHIDNRNEVHMRVWERGTGETLACGTGCCAITTACALRGITGDEITLHVRGGELSCRYDREANKVFMTGPAEFVFDGEIAL
ncbi:MAG: diaminopimelate epimerase [Lachnospiraceae bacterium]|nr:diaminopimelate epimerase [Lachnospiraceae bacterium]